MALHGWMSACNACDVAWCAAWYSAWCAAWCCVVCCVSPRGAAWSYMMLHDAAW